MISFLKRKRYIRITTITLIAAAINPDEGFSM
jgi:hypothetical protein